jgi:hypothetical protein
VEIRRIFRHVFRSEAADGVGIWGLGIWNGEIEHGAGPVNHCRGRAFSLRRTILSGTDCSNIAAQSDIRDYLRNVPATIMADKLDPKPTQGTMHAGSSG